MSRSTGIGVDSDDEVTLRMPADETKRLLELALREESGHEEIAHEEIATPAGDEITIDRRGLRS